METSTAQYRPHPLLEGKLTPRQGSVHRLFFSRSPAPDIFPGKRDFHPDIPLCRSSDRQRIRQRQGTSMGIIFFLLFFITGPAEEIYWRGYVQDSLMYSLGETKDWLVTTAIYAGVHLWSFNFMLIAAAGMAGAFWGLMYRRWRSLTPAIISNSLRSAVIFAVSHVIKLSGPGILHGWACNQMITGNSIELNTLHLLVTHAGFHGTK